LEGAPAHVHRLISAAHKMHLDAGFGDEPARVVLKGADIEVSSKLVVNMFQNIEVKLVATI
jgi:hypothetical protein